MNTDVEMCKRVKHSLFNTEVSDFRLTKINSPSPAVWMFRLEPTDSFPKNANYRIDECQAVAVEEESFVEYLIING